MTLELVVESDADGVERNSTGAVTGMRAEGKGGRKRGSPYMG